MTGYQALREARHEMLRVRGLDMHLTRWGPEPSSGAPPILLLHGWLDAGATFQFLVDAFREDRPVAALDWRGFGRSEWPQDGYWFPDYLADLDEVIEQISYAQAVCLVGHSMGGNIASIYAGIRAERVSSVINLEGLGLPRTTPDQAPTRLLKWLQQQRGELLHKEYESFEQLAEVIRFRYPRFSEARARFVAKIWGRTDSGDRVMLSADPRHHWVNPVLYKREDAEACWRGLRAPMLMLLGESSDYLSRLGADGTVEAFRRLFPSAEIKSVTGAGHMLHIEQPEVVASLVEDFLDARVK